MADKSLKIMHGLSEVAGQNIYSVMGLRELGVDAESVVYDKHPFGYSYDKCLHIDKTKRILWPYYIVKLGVLFVQAIVRYNTFHFHYGRSILQNYELGIYDIFERKYFYEFHGDDLRDREQRCRIMGIPFNPSEASKPRFHRRNAKISRKARGIILHDDELIPYLPQKHAPVYVVPLRINVDNFRPFYPDENNNSNIRIVHAPSNRAGKGSKYVLEAFERLKEKYNNIELVLVEGKTQAEAIKIYETADIIVDQLYAGTYGVFAIECMALGKPVITYISDKMHSRLPEELPIQSGSIYTVGETMERLINDGHLRRKLGIAGREYVEAYHDYRVIAYVLKEIYESKASPKTGREAFAQVKRIKECLKKNNTVINC